MHAMHAGGEPVRRHGEGPGARRLHRRVCPEAGRTAQGRLRNVLQGRHTGVPTGRSSVGPLVYTGQYRYSIHVVQKASQSTSLLGMHVTV